MATKKNNKTEHVLKLITKNHEDPEDITQQEQPVPEEFPEGVLVEKIEAEDETEEPEEGVLDMEIDKAPEQAPGEEFEFQPELRQEKIEDKSKLLNLAESLTTELLPEVVRRMRVCDCKNCTNDILALALNSLPPKYVTTDSGKQYKMLEMYRAQYETDVIAALTRACVRVKGSPRHA